MASCTYNKGLSGNPYVVLTVTQSSQSIANNTSTLSWNLKIYRPYNIESSASKAYSVTINGTKVKSGTTTIGGSGTKTIASGTTTVSHNSNGTKTVNFSFSFTFDITWSGTKIGTGSASGSMTLTTIPRASSISSISGNTIGSTVTVSISRADDSFTHKVFYTAPGQTTLVSVGTNIETSASFTPSMSDCSYLPNATSGTAKITLETYSGSTKIGTATKTFTLKVPNTDSLKPLVSIFVTEAVSTISENIGAYVKGLSKLKITPTGTGKYGSTIKSYKITANGATYKPSVSSPAITTDLLTTSGTLTITVQVTDSRGRVGENTATVTVYDYDPPYIDNFKVERCDENGTVSDDGIYLKVTIKGGITDIVVDDESKNAPTYALFFKESTSTGGYTKDRYVGEGYLTTSIDTTYNLSDMYEFDTEKTYDLFFTVSDSFSQFKKTYRLSTAFTLVDYLADGKGIAFGKVASETGVADFNLKIKANKGITYPEIPANTDLNDLKDTGVYKSIDGKIATYTNCPINSGTFLIEIYEAGNEGQLFQRLTYCSKTNSVRYERFYYGSTWGDWAKTYDQALYDTLTQIGTTYSASLSVQITDAGIDNPIDGASLTVPPGTYVITAGATINSASSSYDRNIQIRLLADESVISRERVSAVNFAEIRTTAIYTATANTVIKCQKSASTAETNKGNTNILAVRIA